MKYINLDRTSEVRQDGRALRRCE